MQTTDYKTALHELLAAGNEFVSRLHELTDQLGDAGTAEWNMAYNASRLASTATELIYRELYPLPSGLADDEPDEPAPVPMVCTTCLRPVHALELSEIVGGSLIWLHSHDADRWACERIRGADTPVKAMVTAGADRIRPWSLGAIPAGPADV